MGLEKSEKVGEKSRNFILGKKWPLCFRLKPDIGVLGC